MEAETGRPFQGPTGDMLTDHLIEHGLRRSTLFIVNATCCPPPIGKTETMMRKAVEACRPALIAQLARFEPLPPVLAMGKWAGHALAIKKNLKGIMNTRGFVREYSLDQARFAEALIVEKEEAKHAKRKNASCSKGGRKEDLRAKDGKGRRGAGPHRR